MGRLSVADIIHRTIVFGAIGFGVSVWSSAAWRVWTGGLSPPLLRCSGGELGPSWTASAAVLPAES